MKKEELEKLSTEELKNRRMKLSVDNSWIDKQFDIDGESRGKFLSNSEHDELEKRQEENTKIIKLIDSIVDKREKTKRR